jgi:hypothetical protein
MNKMLSNVLSWTAIGLGILVIILVLYKMIKGI